MSVQATNAAGIGGTAPGASASASLAASLLAANRLGGALDAPALAAAVKAQAGGDEAKTAALATALEAQMTPVERGQFAAALHADSQEGIGSFFEGAVKGDFAGNPSWSATAGQVAMGFVPIAGQIADVRDAAHAIGQIWNGETGGWTNLAASAVGFIPGVGDAVKGLIRGGEKASAEVAGAVAKHADEAVQAGEKLAVKRFSTAAEFNASANKAAANTRYEYGSYAYTTDAKGRVQTAEGKIALTPTGRNDNPLQSQIGHEGRDTDVGFHLIADRFGGQTNRLNVVPGNGKPIGDGLPNLNTGAYKRFENTVADIAAKPGNTVEVKIEAKYEGANASKRPDDFIASYRVNDGKWRTQSFVNK
ncbi:DNA/RNA non-specific endonuclease [Sphingomonas sp. NFR15]|uniref:DNA/RNA non-specific endonuclease n=1 Tax=Sphingomonas sp. NFR15 TaxID=1566282 RepID=UPI0008882F9D|nr:DNA/RNA non-specific endonuclease [Sphingomonas sp. NFR15]SDA36208.1 DNA/RNA non-specific endonuclease [Sphingomonas sp. NFR15]